MFTPPTGYNTDNEHIACRDAKGGLPEAYTEAIKCRDLVKYCLGLFVRWKQNFKYAKARNIARRRGATIGEGVIMPVTLARKANRNLIVGSHTSIQTDRIDLRSPVKIGCNVIIGTSEIITTSHNIDSPEWEHKYYGIEIEDYVWIANGAMILPSCRRIGYGAVVGSGSVVVKNVGSMSVVGGNPAVEFKMRKIPYCNLVVESLLGGDFEAYKKARSL